MSRVLNAAVLLLASSAFARPWNGIDPGTSSVIDVVGKFGEPSKRSEAKGKQVLVYSGDRAINGTIQVHFKVNPASQTVDRIDVYPAPEIKASQVEESYGGACDPSSAGGGERPCFYKRQTETKHVYYLYLKLGLAVFFKDDQTVRSFSFLSPAAVAVTNSGAAAGTTP